MAGQDKHGRRSVNQEARAEFNDFMGRLVDDDEYSSADGDGGQLRAQQIELGQLVTLNRRLKKEIDLCRGDSERLKHVAGTLAGIGLGTIDVAAIFGMHPRDFQKEYGAAMMEGKALAVGQVGMTAFRMAVSGESSDMTRFYLRTVGGFVERQVVDINANVNIEVETEKEKFIRELNLAWDAQKLLGSGSGGDATG